ncbi:MAG: hypothetical protein J5828_00595 [Desulfovibrionaceae bacterium]|nr:hypothetical protein [Desulfovibrionaceae bacterium]
MMSSLRIVYRCLFAAACCLALAAVLLFSHYTRAQDPAAPVSFFTYLFSPPNPDPPMLGSTLVQDMPEPGAQNAAASQAAPPDEEDKWQPLSQGRAAGKGSIEALTPLEHPDGSLELRLPYTGKAGQYAVYRPAGYVESARNVDLYGEWTKGPSLNLMLKQGDIKRLQAVRHPQAYRVAAVGKDTKTPLDVSVSASRDVIRIVFCRAKNPEQPQN